MELKKYIDVYNSLCNKFYYDWKILLHIIQLHKINSLWGFPDSSVGKESACNAGDSGSIPGLGRSAGEGISYPLLGFSCGSAGKESSWVQSLG